MSGSIWNLSTVINNQANADNSFAGQRFLATAGTVSGTTTVFTLTNFSYVLNTGTLDIYINGVHQDINIDFIESGTNSFTILGLLNSTDIVTARGLIGASGNGQALQGLNDLIQLFAQWLVFPSTQPANTYLEINVPQYGTVYHDNIITWRNRSVSAGGATGNAALRFNDAGPGPGKERGAMGYSRSSSTSTSGYYPNLMYIEIGNINGGGDTDDTHFGIPVTYLPGSTSYPSGLQYMAMEINPTTGDMTYDYPPGKQSFATYKQNFQVGLLGTPRTFNQANHSTYTRYRERGSDDKSGATINVDTGTVKDNNALYSLGWFLDAVAGEFSIVGSPANDGSLSSKMISVIINGLISLLGNVQISTVGTPKQFALALQNTYLRIRENTQIDFAGFSTNLNNSNIQDDATKSSWKQLFGWGAGVDSYIIQRFAPGSSTGVNYSTIDSNGNLTLGAGNINISAVGKTLSIKSGTNGMTGSATMTSGSVVVSNTNIDATKHIIILSRTDTHATTPGHLTCTLFTGSGFQISSSAPTDASTISYVIIATS